MINVKNLAISQDGGFKRVSIAYDELSDEGKIIGTNNRITKIVTEQDILDSIDVLMNYANTVIEEG
mgnify:CR=1 FL=1